MPRVNPHQADCQSGRNAQGGMPLQGEFDQENRVRWRCPALPPSTMGKALRAEPDKAASQCPSSKADMSLLWPANRLRSATEGVSDSNLSGCRNAWSVAYWGDGNGNDAGETGRSGQ